MDPLHLLLDDRLHLQLVFAVDVGVYKADRHRLDPKALQLFDNGFGVFAFHVLENGAVRQGAFIDFKHQIARDGRLRALYPEVIQIRSFLPADLQHIPEPLGGNQGSFGAFALKKRIGGNGGAVDEIINVLDGQTINPGDFFDAFFNANGIVAWGRRDLCGIGLSFCVVVNHNICEGSADIHTKFVAQLLFLQ